MISRTMSFIRDLARRRDHTENENLEPSTNRQNIDTVKALIIIDEHTYFKNCTLFIGFHLV